MSHRNPVHTSLFLVLVGICAAMNIWKLPPALPFLQQELGLDLVASGFLLSSVQIAGMSLGLMTGLFAERIGLRRSILIGLLILTIAPLGAVLLQTKTALLVSRAIEGCGFLMVILPVPALIKRLVSADLISRMLGIWGCYMSTGAVIILLAGAWLLSMDISWHTLWLLLSSVAFLMFLLSLVFIPSDAKTAVSAGTTTADRPSIISMVLSTLSTFRVWLVALTFGMYSAQWSSVIGFLPTVYDSAGISGLVAGLLTALVAGSNVIGNLSAGRLLYKGVSVKKLLITAFLSMMIAAIVAFGLPVPVVVQFFAIVLFSILGGLIPASLFVLAVTYAPTPQTTAATVGWVQQCSSLGQFIGAPVVALVVSWLGGWQWAWVATSAFALLGIIMALKLCTTPSDVKA